MYHFGYSPFTDEEGKQKNIFEICFTDLYQLKSKDIEEGTLIEYKQELADSVSGKLPKIITSFANERGGWLFIGIEDGTKGICPIPEEKYESQINNKLKELTSPFPHTEIRFLKKNASDENGVLVVWVPEGDRPPYIANGRVYVRRGSNSSPLRAGEDRFTAIEDRYHLDKLYQKSEENKGKIEDFCNKEISVYNTKWHPFGGGLEHRGVCNIYVIPRYALDLLSLMDQDQLADYFIEKSSVLREYSLSGEDKDSAKISMNMKFNKSSTSYGSLVFRASNRLENFERTIAWELFYDGKARFHIPMNYFDSSDDPELMDVLIEALGVENVRIDDHILQKFRYVDGKSLLLTIWLCLGGYFHSLKDLNRKIEEAIIIIELEDIRRDALYFDLESYRTLIKEKGLLFSDKEYYMINKQCDIVDINESDIMWYLMQVEQIFEAFGFSAKSYINTFSNLVQDMQRKQEKL
jgi:hypothetical protein